MGVNRAVALSRRLVPRRSRLRPALVVRGCCAGSGCVNARRRRGAGHCTGPGGVAAGEGTGAVALEGPRVAGLGDGAVSDRYGLLVATGRWLFVMRLLNVPLDDGSRDVLIGLAARIAAKLPHLDEETPDATDSKLAHDAWGAASRLFDG